MGRMTICVGAMRGGRIRPSSSACAMRTVPMSRVLTPQLVVQRKFLLALARLEFDAAGLGKILPEEMRRAGLDGLAILHHGLDA